MNKPEIFIVKILFTQNVSWQGSVEWIRGEDKKSQCFRSALELIRLIDSAVETENRKDWEDAPNPSESGT